jgi:anti-anti-sigma regulatory factor
VHRDRLSRPAAWARLGSGAQASSPLRAAFTRPPPTLILAGEADESNYRQLTAALTAAATAGDEWLLVDLASLTYCDLAGLRAIVSLPTWHRPVRRVVLRDASAPVRDALRILGWDETPGVTLESPS